MCIMAPVSPMGPAGTSTRSKASDLDERAPCQLPGIRIEPTSKHVAQVGQGTHETISSPPSLIDGVPLLGDDLPDNDASRSCRSGYRERLECRADKTPLPDKTTPNPQGNQQ